MKHDKYLEKLEKIRKKFFPKTKRFKQSSNPEKKPGPLKIYTKEEVKEYVNSV